MVWFLRRLPSDFDRELYLKLNPDVQSAGIDPARHYLRHGRREGRRYGSSPASDSRSRCLTGIDIGKGRGLEIGPLNRPLLPASEGRVFYADHFSTEALRKKYAGDPAVPQQDICKVDFDLSRMRLRETGRGGSFDYVVASHVIEHVPDLIGWLGDIAAILNVGGKLALVIPDKRFTFDLFRRESTFWMVQEAVGRERPDIDTVLDYIANVVSADAGKLWSDTSAAQQTRKIFSAANCVDVVKRHAAGEYIDVHCWVFTPSSFLDLIRTTIERSGLHFRVSFFKTTPARQLEFYVQLEKTR